MEQATAAPLKKTPLNARHRASGARMVEFGGWDMPVEYSGIVDEHLAVRDARRAVRRQPHGRDRDRRQGRARRGPADHLQRRVEAAGRAGAVLGLADAAGHVCRRPARVPARRRDHFLLVVNAGEHLEGLRAGSPSTSSRPATRWPSTRARATRCSRVQGPRRVDVLQPLTGVDLRGLKYYWFAHGEVASVRATISRTGYTGEDGFEVFVPPQSADRVWLAILEAGQAGGVDPVRPWRARHTAARSGHAPLRQRHRRDDDGRSKPIWAGSSAGRRTTFIGRRGAPRSRRASGVARKLVASR